MSTEIIGADGHKIIVRDDGKMVSRGGLVAWFETRTCVGEPCFEVTLSCATHRDWALKVNIQESNIAAAACTRAEYIASALAFAERDAFESRDTCRCATPLRLT